MSYLGIEFISMSGDRVRRVYKLPICLSSLYKIFAEVQFSEATIRSFDDKKAAVLFVTKRKIDYKHSSELLYLKIRSSDMPTYRLQSIKMYKEYYFTDQTRIVQFAFRSKKLKEELYVLLTEVGIFVSSPDSVVFVTDKELKQYSFESLDELLFEIEELYLRYYRRRRLKECLDSEFVATNFCNLYDFYKEAVSYNVEYSLYKCKEFSVDLAYYYVYEEFPDYSKRGEYLFVKSGQLRDRLYVLGIYFGPVTGISYAGFKIFILREYAFVNSIVVTHSYRHLVKFVVVDVEDLKVVDKNRIISCINEICVTKTPCRLV